MKSMGGYAGLATGMIFATEYQGEATPHAHGFVSLANMYQHHNLEEIGQILQKNASAIREEDMLTRVTQFVEHLQREEHVNDDEHQRNLVQLEQEFHSNNAGPQRNVHLATRPASMYNCVGAPCAWNYATQSGPPDNADVAAQPAVPWEQVQADAASFQRKFDADVQFIFSHVQHHWHAHQQGRATRTSAVLPHQRAQRQADLQEWLPKKGTQGP